ncbi:hypothetical protein EDD11_004143, partial [Mortierella claussenii]
QGLVAPIQQRQLGHDHPRYFGEVKAEQSDEPPNLKRYQLFDRPVPSFAAADNSSDSTTHHDDSEKDDTDLTVIDLSIGPKSGPLLLEVIREEDEEAGHSKRPSQVMEDEVFEQQDREMSMSTKWMQPLQESNGINNNTTGQQQSVEGMYQDMSQDLERRIQQAAQQGELQLADRVQRLEVQTGAAVALSNASDIMQYVETEEDRLLMVPSYHSRGSSTLRKEMLSNASQKIDELDDRVEQMESMVSYKLNDIEYKVQGLQEGHHRTTHAMDEASMSQQDSTSTEIQMYRPPQHDTMNEALDIDSNYNSNHSPNSTALVDTSTIMELRQELQSFGMQYQELNDSLLTDLMSQMRDAKLMLYDSVDEVDKRLGMRVDRIEAEMHAKLLTDIENRIQERVRAMEHTSHRLERCFEKMEGRLGALETVLASTSRRQRPESAYQALQVQQQKEQQQKQQQKQTQEQDSLRAAFEDPNASPESPLPSNRKETSATSFPKTTSTVPSSASIKSSDSTIRPTRIITSGAMLGHGATRPQQSSQQQNLTQGPFSASTAGTQRTFTSVGLAGGPRSAGYVASASPKKVSSAGRMAPTEGTRGPAGKLIRRPSSYKELLHFWKAGASSMDLLNDPSVAATLAPASAPVSTEVGTEI